MRLWTVGSGFESLHPSHINFNKPGVRRVFEIEGGNPEFSNERITTTEPPVRSNPDRFRHRLIRDRWAFPGVDGRSLEGPPDTLERHPHPGVVGPERPGFSPSSRQGRFAADCEEPVVGSLEDQLLSQCEPCEQAEIPGLVIGAPPEGGKDCDAGGPGLVEGVGQCLVEIGTVLIRSMDEAFFSEPGPGR